MNKLRANLIVSFSLATILGGIPVMSGCDKTKSEHDVTVTHPDGSSETEKSKQVEKPNGTVETKTETSTTAPSTP